MGGGLAAVAAPSRLALVRSGGQSPGMHLPRPDLLVDCRPAPNPRRVRIFMAEKGIALPTEHVDIMAGEQFREHAARVGTHHVPAVRLEDGRWLTESVAICRYLEALHPEPALFGTTAEEIGAIEMWIRRVELTVMAPLDDRTHRTVRAEVVAAPERHCASTPCPAAFGCHDSWQVWKYVTQELAIR